MSSYASTRGAKQIHPLFQQGILTTATACSHGNYTPHGLHHGGSVMVTQPGGASALSRSS